MQIPVRFLMIGYHVSPQEKTVATIWTNRTLRRDGFLFQADDWKAECLKGGSSLLALGYVMVESKRKWHLVLSQRFQKEPFEDSHHEQLAVLANRQMQPMLQGDTTGLKGVFKLDRERGVNLWGKATCVFRWKNGTICVYDKTQYHQRG